MASPSSFHSLLRSLPSLRSQIPRLPSHRRLAPACLSALSAAAASSGGETPCATANAKPPFPPPPPAEAKRRESLEAKSWADHPDFRRWKDKEEEILKDIEPITLLTKDILHSDRYRDGEFLCPDDEKEVVEKLLAYHPHSEDKIGCGLDSIMVDRHPAFRNSRCLFVVRTDGRWIDFSYQKCLRAYIREKYPSYAEKFIREHFKRS